MGYYDISRVYIDTQILIGTIIDKSEQKSIYNRLINDLTNSHNIEVHIPQIIVGECFCKLVQKSDNDRQLSINIKCFSELISKIMPNQHRRCNCFPILEGEILNKALEIKKSDSKLDYFDSLIVSHAILDSQAEFLYTGDRSINDSNFILDLVNNRDPSWKKLRIKDPSFQRTRKNKKGY